MLRTFIFCSLFFLSNWINAQIVSKIDFDQIKKEITDSTSVFYYPDLLQKAIKLDTTISSEEFKRLYYGNAFQSYYYPYGSTEKEKNFLNAFGKQTNFNTLVKLGNDVLKENPVNLEVLLKMILLFSKEGKKEEATIYAKFYVAYLEVIYSSGNGMNCDNGFVVISVDDEYRIVGDLGLNVLRQALIDECDLLTFSKKGQKRKNRIKQLYFNVRIPLTYLSKSFNKSDLPEPDVDPDEEE